MTKMIMLLLCLYHRKQSMTYHFLHNFLMNIIIFNYNKLICHMPNCGVDSKAARSLCSVLEVYM